MSPLNQENYYARCIVCGVKYRFKSQVPFLCGCGNQSQILYPKDDVVIGSNRSNLLELCKYARETALALTEIAMEAPAGHPNRMFSGATKIYKAIEKRILAQKGHRIKINWHELKMLGWWASQFLMGGGGSIVFTPSKLQGTVSRMHDYMMDLAKQFPEREPLTSVFQLARDRVSQYFEEGAGKGTEAKTLTQDQIEQFPELPKSQAELEQTERDLFIPKIEVQVPAAPADPPGEMKVENP